MAAFAITVLALPACQSSATATPEQSATSAAATRAADAKIAALLAEGGPTDTESGYFESASPALAAAASGDDDQRFRQLGKLLVQDGFGSAIINLSREMNGSWYEWSEERAPSSEPDAFIVAWRHVVTAMRSAPGSHFKFLWTVYPKAASVEEAWPGSAYVDYVGTDMFDWYGGPHSTYPRTSTGALDWTLHWQQDLTSVPGGLTWIAKFSQATGKPIIIPEYGLDFHTFGGQDDVYFLTHMVAWMKANHAIGLYWGGNHLSQAGWPGGPLLADQGEAAQKNTVGEVNALGTLLGGHLQYAGVYLDDQKQITDATAQEALGPWENSGYQLILSVDIVPNPPAIKSYSGSTKRGQYQLADYPDAVAALKHGIG